MAATNVIFFHSGAVADDTLEPAAFEGEERLSTLYRFKIALLSKKADVDLAALLSNPAWIGLKAPIKLREGGSGTKVVKIHGMLIRVRQEEKAHDWYRYHAVLVPRLWKLMFNHQSRVFQDMKVTEIIEKVLKDAGFSGSDFALKTTGSYPTREYVVQYQESDF